MSDSIYGMPDAANAAQSARAMTHALQEVRSAMEETQRSSVSMFRTLENSSDAAVKALVRGTQTWREALGHVMLDLEVKMAQIAARELLNLVRGQALKLFEVRTTNAEIVAANTAKNAAITTGDDASQKAGAQASAFRLIKQIQADAAATYAGVFAYMAPFMGPAAAIPAGISAAAVAAMQGLVSLDVGAWNVPKDMPAYIHAGEMVVPQPFAESLRQGGGLGGGNVSITIQSIDTQSGARFIQDNAGAIAAALGTQMRHFNRAAGALKN